MNWKDDMKWAIGALCTNDEGLNELRELLVESIPKKMLPKLVKKLGGQIEN